MDEQKLIKEILKGKRQALFFFWKKYQNKVLAYIKQKIANQQDAEEVLQDIFLACLESLRDFNGNCSLSTYLYSIARNKIIDYYRKKKIKQIVFSQIPGLENLVSELLSPDERVIRKELQNAIKRAFLKIGPEQARIIYLKYERNFSLKEIAKELCLTVKAVESRLYRARLAFIKIFNEEDQNFKTTLKKTKRNFRSAPT